MFTLINKLLKLHRTKITKNIVAVNAKYFTSLAVFKLSLTSIIHIKV